MKRQLKIFIPYLFSLILFFTVSCGSSGSVVCLDSDVDLTGIWTISETISTSSPDCASDDGVMRSFDVEVDQDGGTITVTVGEGGGALAGAVFTGSTCADVSDWSGSFDEDDGTTTVSGTEITAASDTFFSGTTNWSWTSNDGTLNCTGTTSLTGTKL